MVSVDDAVIARLKTHGQNFEILVDCDNAISLKGGKDVDMKDVLATEQIFTDSKKGELAPENSLKQIFGTEDNIEIAKQIIQKGDIQLTSEYRKKLLEEKRSRIINMIHRYGVDPKTHLPHPMTRLENAFETAKITIDEYKDVKQQVQEITKKLLPILPIKFETKEVQLTIPAEYGAKSYNLIHSLGKVLNEQWQNDGSLMVVIEIPGGLEEELYEKVNSVCHGNVEAKVLSNK